MTLVMFYNLIQKHIFRFQTYNTHSIIIVLHHQTQNINWFFVKQGSKAPYLLFYYKRFLLVVLTEIHFFLLTYGLEKGFKKC